MVSRLWDWAKHIATDYGEQPPVEVAAEERSQGYCLRLTGTETCVPVTVTPNPHPHPILKEIHACSIAGRRLEAESEQALRAKVVTAIERIAPGGELPVVWFRSDPVDYELPVYREDGAYVCPVLGARTLRADDLAGIRATVTRYLIHAGYAGDAEDVDVLALRRDDLTRVPPAAVIRSHADPAVWEVLMPWDDVQLLAALRADPDRFAAGVQAEVWEATESSTQDTGTRLVARLDDAERSLLELPVRATTGGDVITALHEEPAITVLLARDAHELAAAVGRHLAASGFLPGPITLEVRAPARH